MQATSSDGWPPCWSTDSNERNPCRLTSRKETVGIMALTFYTVLVDKDGFPVKYCQAQDTQGLAYGRVQTFRRKAQPFADPGEACGEFEAWLGAHGVPCYLEPQRFRTKVKKLHQLCRTRVRRQKRWSALVDPRLSVMQQEGRLL